ncbi:MAG TPA: alkaline phosphatase family protein [Chloroflexota bacterium]|nr:alkaline phosphatase family protein [Chloroflexota bacterium]
MRLQHSFPAAVALAAITVVVYGPVSAAPAPRPAEPVARVATANPAVKHNVKFTRTAAVATRTPIKHLVVIFDENVAFDHYFGTYPHAQNLAGEPSFYASPNTPGINGLNSWLLHHNPNLYQPARLSPSQAKTCDQDHAYAAEQKAEDHGLMDQFVQNTSGSSSSLYCPKGVVMDYFDGNTVTALWNYAQDFAMNDNSYGTTFGPSTPGALNLISGDTGTSVCGPASVTLGAAPACSATPPPTSLASNPPTSSLYGDANPYYDMCSGTNKATTAALAGNNIGDVMDTAKLTWGWFQGGFDNCKTTHPTVAYDTYTHVNPATDTHVVADYSAHHEPFQYYYSTSNPNHLTPSSPAMIGSTDRANHQYDLTDFWTAAGSGNLPAVSFLKASAYEDGHAGYSDPLDEQAFLTGTINKLQQLPSWSSTAVIIAYDDSDGWYDHVFAPVANHSSSSLDVYCGSVSNGAPARCGYGPRLPFLVISPWAKQNYVSQQITDQSSIISFAEYNWRLPSPIDAESADAKAGSILDMFDFNQSASQVAGHKLFVDPRTGRVVQR